MSEADLCLRLEEYFSDWEIYKEVPAAGGRCDMYVKKGALWISVEAKMQFSTKLIFQALTNMPHSHYSYVAIPDLKGSYEAGKICSRLGIGVLQYRTQSRGCEEWYETVKPVFNRNITPFRVLESMKQAVAGVQHNTQSEYKISLYHITMWIKRKGGRINIKEIFENEKFHYGSSKSAMQCITKLCRTNKIKEFRIEGKDFVLNETVEGIPTIQECDATEVPQ